MYIALAAVAGASVILGVWQRAQGVSGLQRLGLVYGERLREVSGGGALRAFGGFTSAAPFSYMLAISVCAWAALALGQPHQRRLAFVTTWLPVTALVGIYLTVDRTTVFALLIALGVFGLSTRRAALRSTSVQLRKPAVLIGVVVAAIVATDVLLLSSFGEGLTSTARARFALWGEYVADFRPFGAGPASAGSAYDKVEPRGWEPPLIAPHSWNVLYDHIVVPGLSEAGLGSGRVGEPRFAISADVRSLVVKRRLRATVRYAPPGRDQKLIDRPVPIQRTVLIALHARTRNPQAVALSIEAKPFVPESRPARSAPYEGQLVNLVRNPSVELDQTGWIADTGLDNGVRVNRDPRISRFGSASLKVSNALEATHAPLRSSVHYGSLEATAGTSYTASAYLRGAEGGEVVKFFAIDSLGRPGADTTGGPAVRLSATWRRYAFTFTWHSTTPALVILMQPEAQDPDQPGRRVTFYVDALQVELGRKLSRYCDGSIPHCRWAGRPHDSTSFRAGRTVLLSGLSKTRRSGSEQLLRIASTRPPLPARTPFLIAVGQETMDVTQIVDRRTYRVRRGANHTAPARHLAGQPVWALFPGDRLKPPPVRTPEPVPLTDPALTISNLRITGLPERTPAERIWKRWFEDTPAALEGDGPGLVDNLYVSWLFQYGLLGVALCFAWVGALLWPMVGRRRSSPTIAAALVGVFLVVSATAVSVWEESPTDVLSAFILAFAFAEARKPRRILVWPSEAA